MVVHNSRVFKQHCLIITMKNIRTVGQSSLCIWKAILTPSITFHCFHHKNNGRVHNIFWTKHRDRWWSTTTGYSSRIVEYQCWKNFRTVGQLSLCIWKAILTAAIIFHYLYHWNNGRVHNIFLHNTEILVVHNNRAFKYYYWITMLKKHQNCWTITLMHMKSCFNTIYHLSIPLSFK